MSKKSGYASAYGRTVERTTRATAGPDHEGFFERLAARRRAKAAGMTEQGLNRVKDNAVRRALRRLGFITD